MKTLTLTNDFHQTSATIRPTEITAEMVSHADRTSALTLQRYIGKYLITRRQAKRAKKALCGMRDCCCGGQFGDRGSAQYFSVLNETYNRDYVIDIA